MRADGISEHKREHTSEQESEHFEYYNEFPSGNSYCCYRYKAPTGEEFSCVESSLECCRRERDAWRRGLHAGSTPVTHTLSPSNITYK